ncbi:MAG: hypothetical protein HY046_08810 [Acidobacteria bacterium]|nr:hypothetical protein [Acidobacteriota bacterium]
MDRTLSRAETLAPAVIELRQADEQSRVRAGRVVAEFGGRSEIRRVLGSGGVDVERRIGRRPPQQTSSRDLTLQFDGRGDWTEATQTTDVRFREGTRTGQSQQARAVRATDMVYLTGAATVSDAVSRTSAASIEINQRTGEILAKGGVRTSYLQATQKADASFVPAFAPQPAHITAEELRANADEGRALYSGKARLWQGDAVIESESIELLKGTGEERQLIARTNVRALIPQTRGSVGTTNAAGPRTLWRARSGQLRYSTSDAKIHLEENVFAESDVGQIQSQRLDIFLADEKGSGQQLARAEATGGVAVKQGDRHGTADRADYFAAEGKFVLSGGKPTLYDAVLGTTTGRQLTFFLADDKILIDSEEGSRTVTRHRVEK